MILDPKQPAIKNKKAKKPKIKRKENQLHEKVSLAKETEMLKKAEKEYLKLENQFSKRLNNPKSVSLCIISYV